MRVTRTPGAPVSPHPQVQRAVDQHNRDGHADRRQRPHEQRSLPVSEQRDRVQPDDHDSGRGPARVKRDDAQNRANLDTDQGHQRRPRSPGQRRRRRDRQNICPRGEATPGMDLSFDDQRNRTCHDERNVPKSKAPNQHDVGTLLGRLRGVIGRLDAMRLLLREYVGRADPPAALLQSVSGLESA